MRILAPLYHRVLRWAAHPRAERYAAALSFAESSFFPVPPDVMLERCLSVLFVHLPTERCSVRG